MAILQAPQRKRRKKGGRGEREKTSRKTERKDTGKERKGGRRQGRGEGGREAGRGLTAQPARARVRVLRADEAALRGAAAHVPQHPEQLQQHERREEAEQVALGHARGVHGPGQQQQQPRHEHVEPVLAAQRLGQLLPGASARGAPSRLRRGGRPLALRHPCAARTEPRPACAPALCQSPFRSCSPSDARSPRVCPSALGEPTRSPLRRPPPGRPGRTPAFSARDARCPRPLTPRCPGSPPAHSSDLAPALPLGPRVLPLPSRGSGPRTPGTPGLRQLPPAGSRCGLGREGVAPS